MKRWFLTNGMCQIKFVEQRDRPDTSCFGSFHDSWEEAHDALVSREEIRVIEAKQAMDKAIKSYKRAMKMTKPIEDES